MIFPQEQGYVNFIQSTKFATPSHKVDWKSHTKIDPVRVMNYLSLHTEDRYQNKSMTNR